MHNDGSRPVKHARCGRAWTERRALLHCCTCGEYSTAAEFRWHRRPGGTCLAYAVGVNR